MEKLNLCEILKGHEGETFYMYGQGDCTLVLLNDTQIENYPILVRAKFHHENGYDECDYSLKSDGTIGTDDLMLFPSKDQRDWNKWIEEQKSKVPKTWSEYISANRDKFDKGIGDYCVDVSGTNNNGWTRRNSPIEKSALALLKIHQLIEVGYGGNVSYERAALCTYENVFKIAPHGINRSLTFKVVEVKGEHDINHIEFHTEKQAAEFLEYPENVQLLKDYFMIP